MLIGELDLSALCDLRSDRTASTWVYDGWRYATDGAICIRVPAPGETDTPERTPPRPPAWQLFSTQVLDSQSWPLPAPEPATGPCPLCEGKTVLSQSQDCPACKGEGEHTCSVCQAEHLCGQCDGAGTVEGPLVQCTHCLGSGKAKGWDDIPISDGISLAGRYADLIAKLPELEMVRRDTTHKHVIFFRFRGGEGAVMFKVRDDMFSRPAAGAGACGEPTHQAGRPPV